MEEQERLGRYRAKKQNEYRFHTRRRRAIAKKAHARLHKTTGRNGKAKKILRLRKQRKGVN